MDCTKDVSGEFTEAGDIIVGDALVESLDEECGFFSVVVEVREFEEDVVEKRDGCVVFLVVVFIGSDDMESVL